MVTGPMPRKPKATRPKANTAGANMMSPRPWVLTTYPMPMSTMMVNPR